MLVRSGIEIGRTLEAIRAAGDTLTASFESGELLFLSRLLSVDPEAGYFVIAWSESKQANAALLASRSIAFCCNLQGTRYEFVAADPRQIRSAGAPAIQLSFPAGMLALRRRAQVRIAVPPPLILHCQIKAGPVSYSAQMVDISMDGIGAILYDLSIQLEPGARLEAARIMHPQRDPVVVDLEVRHVTRVSLREGGYANRAGCRFIGAPKDIEDLIRLFVTALGAPGESSP